MNELTIFYWFCRWICRLTCMMLLKYRGYGQHHIPRSGGVLLISNHQSFMDPPLAGIGVERPCSFMARDSLFHNRWFAWLIRAVNAFPVRRNTADIGAIKETLRRLKQGRIVVLFPEGTRSEDGQIQPLQPGMGGIAKKAKVPIVPVLIDGMMQAWPRHQLLPHSGDVIVEYGPPILPGEYEHMSVEELMAHLQGTLLQMQYRRHRLQPHRRLKWYKRLEEMVRRQNSNNTPAIATNEEGHAG